MTRTSGRLAGIGVALALALGPGHGCAREPAQPADGTVHESAEAALAIGAQLLVVGSVESPPPGGAQAGARPRPGANPIFEDDAYYSSFASRLDGRGRPVWKRLYQAPRECHARSVAALRDGFIIAGEYRGDHVRAYQGWLLRIAGNGDEVWRQALGRPGVTGFDAVLVHGTGTIIAAGVQQGKGWIVAMDEAGALRWQRELDEVDEVTAVIEHGSGVLLAGVTGRTTTSSGVSRLMALDAQGQPLWSTAVPAQGRGELTALAALPGGGVAAGHGYGEGDDRRGAWVVRFAADGAILSSVILPGLHTDTARAVVATGDGGYAIAGDSLAQLRDRHVRVWRMAAGDTLRWERTYGGAGHDVARGLALTGDGGLLVVGARQAPGQRKTRALAIRVDADGNETWLPGHEQQ